MTMTTTQTSSSQRLHPSPQWGLVWIVLAIALGVTVALLPIGWRNSCLFVLGIGFGLTLYHASFGFASAYRKWFVLGEVDGILAQLLMLAIATLLFMPVLLHGSVGGATVRGAVAPVAVQGAIGAFLFGVGMQLGSGCACGTLYTIGGGSGLMVITLLTFMVGSFWASLTSSAWQSLPQLPPISLLQTWGWSGGALQLAVLGLLAWGLWRSQPQRTRLPILPAGASLLYGPWSVVIGAIGLAGLNWLTLLVAGRPWGVTWGFTLWGAKLAQLFGWNPATSEFWSQGVGATALANSIFTDFTSLTNLGVIIGAALAAALAGRLSLRTPPSQRAVGAAIVGGVLMGYGARLAFGCNVGAYFGGIASTSLHGWLWIAFALCGTGLGIKLRSGLRL